jgi:hypothetical protein
MLCTVLRQLPGWRSATCCAYTLVVFTCGHGMYVWVLDGGGIAALQVDGDGERV